MTTHIDALDYADKILSVKPDCDGLRTACFVLEAVYNGLREEEKCYRRMIRKGRKKVPEYLTAIYSRYSLIVKIATSLIEQSDNAGYVCGDDHSQRIREVLSEAESLVSNFNHSRFNAESLAKSLS